MLQCYLFWWVWLFFQLLFSVELVRSGLGGTNKGTLIPNHAFMLPRAEGIFMHSVPRVMGECPIKKPPKDTNTHRLLGVGCLHGCLKQSLWARPLAQAEEIKQQLLHQSGGHLPGFAFFFPQMSLPGSFLLNKLYMLF